ncbi:MAG: branched-chain amino acid ABC transporter permease [Armatimonadota bacterium]|nr:branched-chain amino acid ABC transporter permease [Armatimonadota bacterium]MDR7408036.1 branched-chain amino acid ABC transporter permease [Armatimonadota bacterium]
MSRSLWVVVAAFAATAPWWLPGYGLYVLTLALVYGVAAVGLNLLTGYGGQVSIGHAGFMAIGAYASALAALRLGWPPWAGMLAGSALGGLAGLLLGLPAVRLHGPYLAVATLGFGTFVSQLVVKWEALTGGYMGLKPPRLTLGMLPEDTELYYVAGVVLVGVMCAASALVRGAFGRALLAVRDSELAAEATGVYVAGTKVQAFSLSAALAGLAGALQAHVVGYISPGDFTLLTSIFLVSAVVVGGLASISGSVVGAVLLTVGFQALSGVRDLRTVLYGLLLVAAVVFFPGGLVRLSLRRRVGWIPVVAAGRREDRRAVS